MTRTTNKQTDEAKEPNWLGKTTTSLTRKRKQSDIWSSGGDENKHEAHAISLAQPAGLLESRQLLR